jgi:hypothetical protein
LRVQSPSVSSDDALIVLSRTDLMGLITAGIKWYRGNMAGISKTCHLIKYLNTMLVDFYFFGKNIAASFKKCGEIFEKLTFILVIIIPSGV